MPGVGGSASLELPNILSNRGKVRRCTCGDQVTIAGGVGVTQRHGVETADGAMVGTIGGATVGAGVATGGRP